MGSAEASAAGLFAELPMGAVHPPDATTTRARMDPKCPLCRAGWCVQQVVHVPGEEPLVLHGLLLH